MFGYQQLSFFHQEKDFEECSAQPQNAVYTWPAFRKHRDRHWIHLEGDFAFRCLLGHSWQPSWKSKLSPNNCAIFLCDLFNPQSWQDIIRNQVIVFDKVTRFSYTFTLKSGFQASNHLGSLALGAHVSFDACHARRVDRPDQLTSWGLGPLWFWSCAPSGWCGAKLRGKKLSKTKSETGKMRKRQKDETWISETLSYLSWWNITCTATCYQKQFAKVWFHEKGSHPMEMPWSRHATSGPWSCHQHLGCTHVKYVMIVVCTW